MNTMKRTLLIVGCGDIALRAAPLLQAHYRLLGLYRRPESRASLRLHGIMPVFGDLDIPGSLGKISGMAHAVLHLAPPPDPGQHGYPHRKSPGSADRSGQKDKGSNVTTTACVHQYQRCIW